MTACDGHWDYEIDITPVKSEVHIKTLYDDIMKLGVIKSLNHAENPQNDDNKLKSLLEENKKLRVEIEAICQELTKQNIHYELLKQEQKLLTQGIKDRHESYLMAKKYYKKFLKLYYTVEAKKDDKQIIFVQFFTESRKDNDSYSVRLTRDSKTERYELLETSPKLTIFEEVQNKLKITNDVPCALCNIRQAFLDLKCGK